MAGTSQIELALLQDRILNIARTNPGLSYKQLASALTSNEDMVKTLSRRIANWVSNNTMGFADKYRQTLRLAFSELEGAAIKAMGDLIADKNFQAAKYILDNRDYGATQKVKAEVDAAAEVNIVIE